MRSNTGIAWIMAIAAALTLALAIVCLAPPQLDADLRSANFAADGGFAYTAPVLLRAPIGFSIASDGDGDAVSNLELYESGRLLDPAHTGHVDIRELGKGRYSHWRAKLWFSASDSSDPRTNGRTYSVSVRVSVNPLVPATVALFDLLALVAARRLLLSDARFRRRFAEFAMLAALALAALVAAGVFGRINAAAGPPKDAALVVATLAHAVFGCVVLIAQWIAGAGMARLVLGARRATLENVLLLGFALSLPLVAVLTATALSMPWGFGLAAALWALCCLPLRRWRLEAGKLADIARVGIAVLPFAIGLGCWMGLNWHGPTETLAGSPSGDLVYYSTSIVSLSKQLYPYLNLGYERQPFDHYFNMLFPLTGAAISKVVTFDPFLFITAGGAAFFVLSLGLTLNLYIRGTGILAQGRHAVLSSVVLALTFLVANYSPFWIVSSIPMIYAVPLTVVLVYWARHNEVSARLLAFALAIVGSALSKVVGAAVLAPFVAASAAPRFFAMPRAVRVMSIVAAAGAAAYGAILLYWLGSLNFAIAPLGPASLTRILRYHLGFWSTLPFVLRDLSAVLLAASAFLLTRWLVAAAIAFGFLLFLVYPFLFDFDFVCATIILGLVACDNPSRLWKFRYLLLGGLLLALPAVLLVDPAGAWSGLAWLFCIGGTVWVALPGASPLTWSGQGRAAAAVAVLLCLGLVAAGRGYLILTSGWQPGLLTPQVRQIWLAVKDRTPPDALIFTDQTGMVPTLLGSWNTYAFIGARQIFVSNLVLNSATRNNRQLALNVLRENDLVLDGTMPPAQLALHGHYSDYFAVVSKSRPVPAGWVRIFENSEFSLYRILSGT